MKWKCVCGAFLARPPGECAKCGMRYTLPADRSIAGTVGGLARAASMTEARRSEVASIAAKARWDRAKAKIQANTQPEMTRPLTGDDIAKDTTC